MDLVIIVVKTNRIGKNAKRIKVNNQPLKKAKNKPETHIAKAIKIVPIFSPKAFYID
jgi:hypothetical protein